MVYWHQSNQEDAKTMAEDNANGRLPFYVSYSTFTTMLDWLKDMKVIPSQFDRSLWEGKFSGGVGRQLVPGLRFLGLLNGDQPTQRLEQLAFADKDNRKTLLQQMLQDAYGADLVEQLPRMTPKMLEDRFAALGSTEATKRKALSFFINAAKESCLQVPSSIAKRARIKASGTIRTRHPRQSDNGSNPPTPPPPKKNDQTEWSLHPVVTALLRDLEAQGSKWTASQRESWVKTFQVGLDYAYPAKTE